MKLMIATILLPFAVQAAEPLVGCKIASQTSCKDCVTRIPASCDENGFVGSLGASLKPAKIQWTISNPKTGTERLVTTDNKTLSLKDLQTAKSLAGLAGKQKVPFGKGEKVSLTGIQVVSGTELFKGQTGKEIAATLKAQNPQRAIASEGKEAHAGGVGRAMKKIGQK